MTGPTYKLRQFGSFSSDLTSDQGVNLVDGAIDATKRTALLTKGSIGAYTILAPTAGAPIANATPADGARITIITTTSFAHVVTSATKGFNGKGSSGTLTFTNVKGNSVTLEAYNGDWWVVSLNGVTVA